MIDIALWFFIGLFSGSVPWSVLITRSLLGRDARNIGDGNPGAANAWKLGGWIVGIIAVLLDVSKSVLPIIIFLKIVEIDSSKSFVYELEVGLIASAPIIGHAWTPFLRFRGGKALATTLGSWIAITSGMALPIVCLFLAPLHSVQKNHAITVTLSLVGMAGFFLVVPGFLIISSTSLMTLILTNFVIVVYKHRNEYFEGFSLRDWMQRGKKSAI